MLQREELDAFIDQLYKDIEKGEALTWLWAASSSAVFRRLLETCQRSGNGRGSHWGLGDPTSPGPCEPCLLPLAHYVDRASPSLWAAWPR